MEKYLKNLSLISHEVRGALSVVKAYMDIMEKGMLGDVNDQQKEKLRLTSDRVDDINCLFFNVVIATRMDAGILSFEGIPFDFGKLVDDVASDFRCRADRFGITLNWKKSADTLQVVGDRMLLYHALANLCSNAFKFTHKGGSVSIKTEVENDTATVIVTDTGIGIHPDEHEKIFESYVQLENIDAPRSGGVGLGLTVTRLVAELAGGAVSMQSRPGEGAMFKFVYPRIESGQSDGKAENGRKGKSFLPWRASR